ncbi:transposase [Rhizobium sp. MHM7A]|uniref:transposase n=1 Tax=Rhizobium sp. MHM7A TaxID=2583233 RepID=UPI001105C684|nr:transposase [Rhizobium sp. MHM7A]TLX14462.1 transposase [Rhizobium sp. MHM7A]
MTDEHEEELALIAARAAEIRAGLNAAYSPEELRRPLSTRCVHALIAATTAATGAKLTALSARIEQLEAGGVRYAGIWQRALPYRKGSVVTSDGAMWIALADTPEGVVPGSDPSIWQLAAKSARPKASGR